MTLVQGPARRRSSATTSIWKLGALMTGAAILLFGTACSTDSPRSASSAEPWGPNAVTPAEYARELAGASAAEKPVIVCTAPVFMYRVGHIPGAVLHGPTGSPEGLNDLMTWAQPLPRSTNLVIYCGCCPLSHCPNLRPAYVALRDMGFTRVRVLLLGENFKVDWIDPGYPFER